MKWLTYGIILLFIGVSLAPTINFNTVKASQEDDLVEVTTQACGIQGYGDTTVKLTRQQYQNLEQYLVEFRARLNQTATREEAIPLFKEAVVQLDKYGLLPRGMSVERAQNLVIVSNQIEKIVSKLHQQIFRGHIQTNDTQNKFCFVVCYTKNLTSFFNLASIFGDIFFMFLLTLIFSFFELIVPGPNIPVQILEIALMFISIALITLIMNKPFSLLSIINIFSVASFFSLGLQGVKRGTIYLQHIYGFTGLRIILNLSGEENLFLGSALLIK